MSRQNQSLQQLDPDLPPPPPRADDHHGHHRVVERALDGVGRGQRLLLPLLQEGGQVALLSGGGAGRVDDVEGHVQQVGQQVHVGVGAAAARHVGEALVLK